MQTIVATFCVTLIIDVIACITQLFERLHIYIITYLNEN